MISSPLLFGDILLGVNDDEQEAVAVVVTAASSSSCCCPPPPPLNAPVDGSPRPPTLRPKTVSGVLAVVVVVVVAVLSIVTLSSGSIDCNVIVLLFRIGGIRYILFALLCNGTLIVTRQV